MSQNKNNTLLATLQQHVPYYLAKYVEWYMAPADQRIPWEELAQCDLNYKQKPEGIKSPEFAEQNWLPRKDVQDALQAYIKYFKKTNLTKLYMSMYEKAMTGDVRAADWVVKFSESEFFDEKQDDINNFLDGVHIKGIQK